MALPSTGLSSLSSPLSEASLHRMTETHFLAAGGLDATGQVAACLGFYRHASPVYCDVSLHNLSSGARRLSSMKLLEKNEPLSGALRSLTLWKPAVPWAFFNFQPQCSPDLGLKGWVGQKLALGEWGGSLIPAWKEHDLTSMMLKLQEFSK